MGEKKARNGKMQEKKKAVLPGAQQARVFSVASRRGLCFPAEHKPGMGRNHLILST